MIYLILDPVFQNYFSSVHFELEGEWMYASKPNEYFELLKAKHFEGDVKLLVSSLSYRVWKEKRQHLALQVLSAQSKIKELEALNTRLLVPEYILLNNTKIANLQLVVERCARIIFDFEEFLEHFCIEIPLSDNVIKEVWRLSLENKLPFRAGVNNTESASMLLAVLEYIKQDKCNHSSQEVMLYVLSPDASKYEISTHYFPCYMDVQEDSEMPGFLVKSRFQPLLRMPRELNLELDAFLNQKWQRCITFDCFERENDLAHVLFNKTIELKKSDSEIVTVQVGFCSSCLSSYVKCSCGELFPEDYMTGYLHPCACGLQYELDELGELSVR